ncbi:MAG: thioredoxin family protein [Saprospiraceae bacterium]
MNIPSTRLALLAFLLCFWMPKSLQAFPWSVGNVGDAIKAAAQKDKLVLLYIHADWCMPCQWMEKNTFTDATLNQYVAAAFVAIKYDAGTALAKEVLYKYEIEHIPAFLVFDVTGRMISHQSGSLPAEKMLTWLQSHDIPAHHLANQIQAVQAPIQEAPAANIAFSVPALQKEDVLEDNSLAWAHTASSSSTILVISRKEQHTFSPKSTLQYAVLLEQPPVDYQTAVRLVGELERKFEQRVEIKPKGDGTFGITIGNFDTTGDAQQFLILLQRNNRQGKSLPCDVFRL